MCNKHEEPPSEEALDRCAEAFKRAFIVIMMLGGLSLGLMLLVWLKNHG